MQKVGDGNNARKIAAEIIFYKGKYFESFHGI